MKKAIFLIIVLLAIVAGASADDRTKISLVESSSTNFDAIPQLGKLLRKPTFIVTKGAPAYFDKEGCWQKLVDGKWESHSIGTFTEGSWRYFVNVRIDRTTDPDNAYVLDNNVLTYINGIRWGRLARHINDNSSDVYIYSPEITLSRSKVSLVESSSTNFDAIPQLGKLLRKPTFIVTKGAPAYFDKEGCWQKLVDGKWESHSIGTFTEGSWRYFVNVRIDRTTDPDNAYVLDNNVLTYINESTLKSRIVRPH